MDGQILIDRQLDKYIDGWVEDKQKEREIAG